MKPVAEPDAATEHTEEMVVETACSGRSSKALRLLVLLLVAVVSLSLSLTMSNAAALNVKAESLKSFAGPAACTTTTLVVSSTNVTGGRTTTMPIANVPAACRSKAMQLTAYGAGGVVRGTATTTTTGAGATTSVTLDANVRLNQVTGIALTIAARGMKTNWAG